MSNLTRWILFFPVSFIVYIISGFVIAYIGGLLRKLVYTFGDIFQLIAFGAAGFFFVWIGSLIVPVYKAPIAFLLAIIMILVNWTSPARKDCRISQVIFSIIASIVIYYKIL